MSNLESMEVIATLQKSCDVLAKAVRDLQKALSLSGSIASGYSVHISHRIHSEVGEEEYSSLFAALDGMLCRGAEMTAVITEIYTNRTNVISIN